MMMQVEQGDRTLNRLYWSACLLLLVYLTLRGMLVPLSHDEVATFYFYIQPGSFMPFSSHVDANGHFLTSALGWICFELFGSSPLSLRLPSLLAFVLLCCACRRFFDLLDGWAARLLFSASFLLVGNFLAYFTICRGYGISMACLLMALYYMLAFVRELRTWHFLRMIIFLQLALAANLTLLFAVAMCTLACLVFQLLHRRLWRAVVLAAYLVHAALLVYWTCYAFYLKEHGALYYGEGSSYWAVTFRSLIGNLFIENNKLTEWIFIAISAALFVAVCLWWRRKGREFINEPIFVTFGLFCALVLVFYLLKKLLGVNYPEDRTGLFFYLFFVCAAAFAVDRLPWWKWYWSLGPAILLFTLSASRVNLDCHPWISYETRTIPPRFVKLLADEEKRSGRRITIAGHRIREFIYGFLNYRSSYKLNHMTSPEALQMNCDYALAVKADKPWYEPWYEEIDSEDCWGFRLLKRRKPIITTTILGDRRHRVVKGDPEFYNCFELGDTTFSTTEPLRADVTFEVTEAAAPLRAWFILQVDADDPADNIYLRSPLDLIRYDWKGTGRFRLSLVSGNMPRKVRRIVLYLWNIDRQPLTMLIHESSLSRLSAPGITVISKAKL